MGMSLGGATSIIQILSNFLGMRRGRSGPTTRPGNAPPDGNTGPVPIRNMELPNISPLNSNYTPQPTPVRTPINAVVHQVIENGMTRYTLEINGAPRGTLSGSPYFDSEQAA